VSALPATGDLVFITHATVTFCIDTVWDSVQAQAYVQSVVSFMLISGINFIKLGFWFATVYRIY